MWPAGGDSNMQACSFELCGDRTVDAYKYLLKVIFGSRNIFENIYVQRPSFFLFFCFFC